MKVIYMFVFTLLLNNFSFLYSQNYYETLGDYNIELFCKVDVPNNYFTTYDCDLMIYDENKQLIDEEYLLIQGNSYEMKKFVINQHTGEEAIFILGIHLGANFVSGNLKCITIKKIKTLTYYIEIPVIITYSKQMWLSEEPKLTDIVKDLDGDGITEIVDNIVLVGLGGLMTARGFTKISHLEEGKFVIANDKFLPYISDEIKNLVDEAKQTRIKCNEVDVFTKNTNENLLGCIVISYALINQLDEGVEIFHSMYECSDADQVEKRILIYYNEIISNY